MISTDSAFAVSVLDLNPTAAADDEGDVRAAPPGAPDGTDTGTIPSVNAGPVRDLLASYRAAYERLDAVLAKRIWPGVDQGALARAFEGLESQTVTFDSCSLTASSNAGAVASCRGRATYVTRLGHRSSHSENRQWTFRLQRSAERWTIAAVETR